MNQQEKETTVETKEKEYERVLAIMSKPIIKNRDLQILENVTQQQASRLANIIKAQYEGEVVGRPNVVKTSSYLKYCGYEKGEYYDEIYNNIRNILSKE